MPLAKPMLPLVAAFLVAPAHAHNGDETVCIGSRPHLVSYDIEGDSLETVRNAAIAVRPAPQELNAYCSGESPFGEKSFCVGANVDATCAKAARSLRLREPFQCSDCFAGLATDFFYNLNISDFRLQTVEVGLKNSHLRAEAVVRAALPVSEAVRGNVSLIYQLASISFKVAGIIPVDIVISMPTVLEYALSFSGAVDTDAGVELDVNLGEHFLKWTKGQGFHRASTQPNLSLEPVLDVDVPAMAKLDLQLKMGLHVSIDEVLSYRMDLNSSMPVEVGLEQSHSHICARGDVELPVDHEADLHFTLLGKNSEIAHWGPKELFRFQRDFQKCLPLSRQGASWATDVVVV
jgi:hypothetical protein